MTSIINSFRIPIIPFHHSKWQTKKNICIIPDFHDKGESTISKSDINKARLLFWVPKLSSHLHRMQHRTATSLTADYDQKRALLQHGIWSYSSLSADELSSACNDLEIPHLVALPLRAARCESVSGAFTCGISAVDALVGPFLGGCVTEICGMPGSGRTTLCLRYAAALARRGERTLWIDTEGCLVPPRGLALPTLRVHDHVQFFALTRKLPSIVRDTAPRLIVVDSIAGSVRGAAAGDSNRTALLWELVNALKRIAAETGCAVLVTNHMSFLQFRGMTRALGQSLAHAATHCFEVRRPGIGPRVLRVLKSPCLPRIDVDMSESAQTDELSQTVFT